MSLIKAILHNKEFRKLRTPKEIYLSDRILTGKLFSNFKRQLSSQMQLAEYLGLHCYGAKGFKRG